MTLPGPGEVFEALEATWPAAECLDEGPLRLRRGEGGGQRVSAASVAGEEAGEAIVARAEAGMAAMGQTPLFVLRPEQGVLDALLAARGYRVVDPVVLMAAPARPGPLPPETSLDTPGLAALWDGGGIGPARRAVMARARGARAVLVRPAPEAPEAAVFVAAGGGGAMLHALHVAPGARRLRHGRALTEGALAWAAAAGAPWVALAVTEANAGAIALYASLGFRPVGRYWYRVSGG